MGVLLRAELYSAAADGLRGGRQRHRDDLGPGRTADDHSHLATKKVVIKR